MIIHVALIATFRLAAGVKSFDLDLPSGSNLPGYLSTALQPGDALDFFPPVAGG